MSDASPWLWALLFGLLLCSGIFSSSETALFSLGRTQRQAAGRPVRRLLARPRDLLVTVLLGNLLVNVLFFAFVTRMHPGDGGAGDLAVDVGALVAILIFGEILPKTLGLKARVGVARFGAPFLIVLAGLLRPLRRVLYRALDASHAVVGRFLRDEPGLTPDHLARVLERSAEEGMLADVEADLMAEIVELGDIRVREIMTPRVDALFLDLDGGNREDAIQGALDARQSWLPVIDGDPDHVVGRARVRDLVNRSDRGVSQLVMPIKLVPEVASALDLLRTLREDRTAEAIVIDEWGGTAGCVTIEDVFEEIVGDLRTEGEARTVAAVPLGEGRYRVPGSLSIRDWNDEFGFRVVPTEFETVGGFVTFLLGRIPRERDVVRWGSLVMEVHEVRGRRVLSIDIGVETSRRFRGAEASAGGGSGT
ncbi:MAG: hemolysin family protein [Planctomycetota bacterium]|nr:hemolysin family protein [Planctomycetota bacterium]